MPSLFLRSRRRVAVVAAAGLMLGTAALGPAVRAQSSLPALGDTVSEDFGPSAERRLGDRIMDEIRRDPAYIDDPLLADYLQTLWQPLLAAARDRGELSADLDDRFAWQAFLVRDRAVNAFALPGGYVGVHLGLIAMTGTRDELASVLAHELSHVTQRHIARGLVQSQRQSLVAMASMILGVLAASRSPDAAGALITGGQAAAIQGQLNFSRDMEREADRIGFGLLDRAGFSQAGMASMFERLQQASRLNDNNAFPYLRTHPLTSERVGEAQARLGVQGRAAMAMVPEHVVMQARARALMDPRPDALRLWLRPVQAADPAPHAALLAAATRAQAAVLLRDWPAAREAFEQAQAAAQGDRAAVRALGLMRAEALWTQGDWQAADVALGPWREDGSRAAVLLAARLDLAHARANPAGGDKARRLQRVTESLQTWVATRPADALGWEVLGQAWDASGQPLRSVRAQAEVRYVLGDLTGAIDRLRAAQRLARESARPDFIEASVVDARLRQLEAERRQRQREEAGGR